jgi:ATP-dependent Lhr-like helicase
LTEAGVTAFASHSSLSTENRRISEDAFAVGRDCVIVATSTLELGIDVGDLDRVIQIDAPGSVASFLQRIGRTGRRDQTNRNCLFLATSQDALLKACAIVDLWQHGYVEPIEAQKAPFHLVAQQLMTLCLEKGRIPEHASLRGIDRVSGISELDFSDTSRLLDHLVSKEFLLRDGGFLSIGPEAETNFGRRHFSQLLSVFSETPSFEVLEGQRCIGYLDWMSLATEPGKAPKAIILAGRSWEIRDIVWAKRKVYVVPSPDRGKSRWHGRSQGLAYPICQQIRKLLLSRDFNPTWTKRTESEMEVARVQFAELANMSYRFYVDSKSNLLTFPTFFGATINAFLLRYLSDTDTIEGTSDDTGITFSNTLDPSRIKPLLKGLSLDHLKESLNYDPQWEECLKFSMCLPHSLTTSAIVESIPHLRSALNDLRFHIDGAPSEDS